MMFIELFVTAGALDPAQRRRVAQRLGTIQELGNGEPDQEQMAPRSAAVYADMFQVVVHEPEVWVVGEKVLTAQDPPHCLVRVHVPGPWRKDLSETLISYATRIIADEFEDGDLPYRRPTVQVHVMGVTEGSIGMLGKAATSDDIVEMLSKPYQEDATAGKALRDPMCGVLVPLDESTATVELDGELFAFCCGGCRTEFLAKREKAATPSDLDRARPRPLSGVFGSRPC
ncbi:YHS domain protein [Nocardia uniformis]|uniref:YHS domain protein n=1 Tax=Nocardia uniformis TaxID=53432 RepID=A0A849BV47_9NOCA|nr:YHS domain protein [Nocardia uniformis]NNH68948.1 YHS domain protein [Nocardia uniformis]